MTGNDLKKIRLRMEKTQTEFAKFLNFKRYQNLLREEKRGRKVITKSVEWRLRAALTAAGLEKYLK